jgi:SAM-dependent methyltransferase
MASDASPRARGAVFDEIAEDYDRHRPAYPPELIERACAVAGLTAGDAVLELGCGTGQLTGSLLERGLHVTAVEPGGHLREQAKRRLAAVGAESRTVTFVGARFEEARLAGEAYAAVFAASSIHWIDPDVSWSGAAAALRDRGLLALVSYFGLEDPWSAGDQREVRAAMARAVPAVAAGWPPDRTLEATLAGVAERRGDVSAAWSWLGGYELQRPDAARLFDDVQVFAVPRSLEHSAAELSALLGTMSFAASLPDRQREALDAELRALQARLGRPIRSSTVACVVTARRAPPALGLGLADADADARQGPSDVRQNPSEGP